MTIDIKIRNIVDRFMFSNFKRLNIKWLKKLNKYK